MNQNDQNSLDQIVELIIFGNILAKYTIQNRFAANFTAKPP